jgi:membrane fusion protein (multidrug efflux system)
VARADASAARSTVVRLTAVKEQKALAAPFDGIIGIPQVEVGAYVTSGTVYATLQDTDTMRVDFSVPEQQIPLVRIGLPVLASTEVDNTSARGRVVAVEPRIDPNSRLVTIRAELETPEGTINPGQFLRVRVELPEESGIIALPQTVLSSNLYGDSVFVVRTEGEGEEAVQKVEQVFVTAGRRSGGLVEIVEGVKPGDQVVTAGQNRLSGGARVTVDNTVAPSPQAALD